jgi:hypothetical protein
MKKSSEAKEVEERNVGKMARKAYEKIENELNADEFLGQETKNPENFESFQETRSSSAQICDDLGLETQARNH